MSRTDPRVLRTRAAFHAALLVRVKRADEITVTAICRESGLNRGTFYLHYTDVDALAAEVARDLIRDITYPWQALRATGPDEFRAASTEFLTRYLDHIDEQRAFYTWLLSPGGRWGVIQTLLDEFAAAIAHGLATSRGLLSSGDSFLVSLLSGALFGVVTRWITAPAQAESTALATWLLTELTAHPVTAPPASDFTGAAP